MASRALDAGIIKEEAVRQQIMRPADFLVSAKRACSTSLAETPKTFPAVSADGAPYLCLDLSLQYALLTQGLKIKDNDEITLVKQVEYRGEFFEAAWPLGAAINTLSSS